jgi:hypothetical protein
MKFFIIKERGRRERTLKMRRQTEGVVSSE